LYVATQKFSDLLKIYETKLGMAKGAAEKKEIRYKLAQIYEEEAADKKKAISAYESILEDSGDELPALRALDRIYQAEQMWQELAAGIPRELALVDAGDVPSVGDLKFRLGAIREDHLGDVEGAIERFRDILAVDPGHDGARRELEKRLEDSKHQLDAAGILEPIYENIEEWRKLIEVHEIQLTRAREKEKKVD